MRSTSSFRNALLVLALALPATALAWCCGVCNECTFSTEAEAWAHQCSAHGVGCGNNSGGSYQPTAAELERSRRFWGDGSSYHVDPKSLPSMLDALRGTRAEKKQGVVHRLETNGIADHAFLAMKGHRLVMDEKWAEAVTAYRSAITLGAVDESILKGLGYALLRQGERDRAIEVLEIAVASSPMDKQTRRLLAEAYDARAYALFVAADFAGSAAAWKRALELDPKDANALANLPRCAEYLSRSSRGTATLTKAEWGLQPVKPKLASALPSKGAAGDLEAAANEGAAAAATGNLEVAKARSNLVFDTALPVKEAVIVALPEIPAPAPVVDVPEAHGVPVDVPGEPLTPVESILAKEEVSLDAKAAELEKKEAALASGSAGRDAAIEKIREEKKKVEDEKAFVRVAFALQGREPRSTRFDVPTPVVGTAPVIATPAAKALATWADLDQRLEFGFNDRSPHERRVERILEKLLPAFALRRPELTVRFLGTKKRTKMQNLAKASLDGHLYIEEAYLNAVPAPSDDELAFVIGHELAHLQQRHIERAVAGMSFSPTHIAELQTNNPKVRALAEEALRAAETAPREREADEIAFDAIRKVGYSTTGPEDFFERVEPFDKGRTAPHDDQIYTHASAASRRENLRQRMKVTP